ncbi:D-alanyl-D-alanine carboxypeptidase [Streptomyces sp. RKND-216]|uniref:D-alanyl-D-alanine carboxypeptidase family protein n=1 Tax=Streptomyces sp. RKND-216 TaxID=2562581 RepID=UPI00109E2D33|nr:D-alanyl-D-alanine carboxypeptidase [Streptomyces sp. RKND-216]THA24872.1 D-alanyl-D-alanine carboxypeptidase [Streptomyces sp. RKND-216]
MCVPTTSTASRPRGLRRARLLALAAATLLTASLPVPTAYAAPTGEERDKKKPPAQMSTIGGARLGEPGTQVDPRPGADAPKVPKKLTARSWIVADAETGHVLGAHNAHWKLAPASTLKMLFADTLLPKFPKEMEYEVTPADLADVGEGSSLVGVKEDHTYTVEDLWLGVFLRSGNDAVHVLSAMNGGIGRTVKQMNAHAKELRALDTHAVSPDGYDMPGQVSSAYDLTLIARSGMQKADFREYVSTVRAQFPGEWKKKKGKDGEKKRKHFEIQNTNRLLTGNGIEAYPGIAGVKNGYTSNAGNTLTAVAEQDGRVLLVTVMHPEDGHLKVYEETTKLFDWGFAAADAVRPVGELAPPATPETDAKPGADGEAGGNEGSPGGSQDPDEASLVEADDEQAGSGGGMKIALGLTGGSLVLLALIAYVVHRRWPMALPDVSRLRRGPGKSEREG